MSHVQLELKLYVNLFFCFQIKLSFLGHQDVWHGYTDIVFQSHAGIPECIATTQVSSLSSLSSSCAILHQNSPAKRPKFEGNAELHIFLFPSDSQNSLKW